MLIKTIITLSYILFIFVDFKVKTRYSPIITQKLILCFLERLNIIAFMIDLVL